MKDSNDDIRENHRRRRIFRQAKSKASDRFTISGAVREREKPKPVTLPRIKGLEESADG